MTGIRGIEVSLVNLKKQIDGRGISISDSAALITNYYYVKHDCNCQGLLVKPGDFLLGAPFFLINDVEPDPTNTIAVVTVSISTEIIQILCYVIYKKR